MHLSPAYTEVSQQKRSQKPTRMSLAQTSTLVYMHVCVQICVCFIQRYMFFSRSRLKDWWISYERLSHQSPVARIKEWLSASAAEAAAETAAAAATPSERSRNGERQMADHVIQLETVIAKPGKYSTEKETRQLDLKIQENSRAWQRTKIFWTYSWLKSVFLKDRHERRLGVKRRNWAFQ